MRGIGDLFYMTLLATGKFTNKNKMSVSANLYSFLKKTDSTDNSPKLGKQFITKCLIALICVFYNKLVLCAVLALLTPRQ